MLAVGLSAAFLGQNVLAQTEQTRTTTWPSDTNRLLFLWEDASQPVRVQQYDGTPVFKRFFAPTARGLVTFDHHESMWLHGGAYVAEDVGTPLSTACHASNQFSLEVTLTPANITQDGPAVIIAMASATGQNLLLGQQKNMLVVQLTTTAQHAPIALCPLIAGASCHLVVSYRPGTLTCYKNGKLILTNRHIQGDLTGWTDQPIVFGNDTDLKHPWRGKLEGIGIYAREILPNEAQQNYVAYTKKMHARTAVPQLIVQAKLLARSDIQTPEQMLPYTQALAMYEYAVEKVIAGAYTAKKIRVAHWVVLDKKTLAQASLPLNHSYRLVLEPLDDNPQLEASLMNDTLPFDVEVGQYFDISAPVYSR